MVKLNEKSCCPCCKKNFKQLKRHLSKNPICKQYDLMKKKQYTKFVNGHIQHQNDAQQINTSNAFVKTCGTSIGADDQDSIFYQEYDSDTEDDSLIYKTMEYNSNCHEYLPSSTTASIKLLKILQQIEAPLYAYESIMDWTAECCNSGVMFAHNYPSREYIINKMSETMCMTGMQPKESPLKLSDDRIIKVTHFDFKEMCFSILNDKHLMNEKNLTFVNSNPSEHKRSKIQQKTLTCIEDGSVYQNTA